MTDDTPTPIRKNSREVREALMRVADTMPAVVASRRTVQEILDNADDIREQMDAYEPKAEDRRDPADFVPFHQRQGHAVTDPDDYRNRPPWAQTEWPYPPPAIKDPYVRAAINWVKAQFPDRTDEQHAELLACYLGGFGDGMALMARDYDNITTAR